MQKWPNLEREIAMGMKEVLVVDVSYYDSRLLARFSISSALLWGGFLLEFRHSGLSVIASMCSGPRRVILSAVLVGKFIFHCIYRRRTRETIWAQKISMFGGIGEL